MSVFSPDKRDLEGLDKARETALVEDILRNATDVEYWKLFESSQKTSLNKTSFSGNFSGELAKHAIEISCSGGYDRKLKIDGILIHWRSMTGEKKTENKTSADEILVDEFFDRFGKIRTQLLRESLEKERLLFK